MSKVVKEPLVSIACITYNQENYIRQCLDGFVMQKTDFSFEIVIHDDASTDKTPSIIKEYCDRYPDLFVPILQSQNKYKEGKGILVPYVFPRCRGRYIALCEGDDYWIDPLKLQKQVDFLEENPEYGLVHTLAKVFIDKTQTYRKSYIGNSKNSLEEILVDNPIVTNTVCVKTQLILDYIREEIFNSRWLMGDYPMWLYVAGKEKIHFIPEVTSVYRILENSASHSSDFYKQIDFYYSSLEISEFFAHYYNKKDIIKYKRNLVFINIVRLYIKNNKRFQFEMIKNEYKKSFISVKLLILIIFSQFEIMRLYLNKRWNK